MTLEEFDLETMIYLSEKFNITFLFDKKGLIIIMNTVDESAVVPTNKVTYARRFEKELLESLDMYLEDLVEFTIKEAKLRGEKNDI